MIEVKERNIKYFKSFKYWLDNLTDKKAKALIIKRLQRVGVGNFGDYKNIAKNLFELRIHMSPGFRIYFTFKNEDQTVFILNAGTKNNQSQDIQRSLFILSNLKE